MSDSDRVVADDTSDDTSAPSPTQHPVGAPSRSAGRVGRWATATAPWLVGGLLITGAWFVVGATPSTGETTKPFEVNTTMDQWGTGRNIAVRVTDATWADAVDDGFWRADGNWLVVTVEAEAVVDDETGYLAMSDLVVDDVRFETTDRSYATMRSEALETGIPQVGTLAFELPDNVVGGNAELRFSASSDPALDSVIVVALDLDDIDRVPQATLEPTTWAAP